MADSSDLIELLQTRRIEAVTGMPIQNVSPIFLDITFSLAEAKLRLSAEAADLDKRSEAFFLTITQTDALSGWKSRQEESTWTPQNLSPLWERFSLEGLWSKPRVFSCYRDPEDEARGLRRLGPLESAAAVEFSCDSPDAPTRRILFYATPEYPGAIELATENDRCTKILSTLIRYDLVSRPLFRRDHAPGGSPFKPPPTTPAARRE